jgi:hypothetical protein
VELKRCTLQVVALIKCHTWSFTKICHNLKRIHIKVQLGL